MRQGPLERDINIAVNGCSGFATSTRKGPFTAMLISCSGGTCLITFPSLLLSPSILMNAFFSVSQGLTVRRATQKDQGTYTCSVEDHSGNKKSKSEFIPVLKKEQPFLRVYSDASDHIITSTGIDDNARPTPVRWVVQIESHPEPSVTW